ncbi:MAG: hypothetical protein AAGF11_13380 [Myxococcota bacterium]
MTVPQPYTQPRSTPQIHAVSFPTATIRSGRVAVAKLECTGIPPEEIRCAPVRPGFTVEVLPTRAREGRFIILGIRITRMPDTQRDLCLLRLSAGLASSLASLTVLR